MGEARSALHFALATVAGVGYDGLALSPAREDLRLYATLLDEGYRPHLFSGAPPRYAGPQPRFPMAGMYLPHQVSSSAHLLDALRTGSHAIGNGPFVELTANGRSPGAAFPASKHSVHLEVNAYASSAHADSIQRVELVYNGRAIERIKGQENQRSIRFFLDTPLPEPGWVFARYVSREKHRFALSSPIWIHGGSRVHRRGLVSKVRVRGNRNGEPASLLVEAWNLGVLLGRFPIPKAGTTLNLPSTATLAVVQSEGQLGQRLSLYSASGAKAWIEKQAQEPESVPDQLSKPALYERLRFLLEQVNVVIPLPPSSTSTEKP
jgi:hypothetical protein